jgi:hypothetical protein
VGDLERCLAREMEELRAEISSLLGPPGYKGVSTERTLHMAKCLKHGEDPGPITSDEADLLERMREYLPVFRELEEEGAFDAYPEDQPRA